MKKKKITYKTKIKANDVIAYDSQYYEDQAIVSLKVSKLLYVAVLDSFDIDRDIVDFFGKTHASHVSKCLPKKEDVFVVLDVYDVIKFDDYDSNFLKCMIIDNLDDETRKELETTGDDHNFVKVYSIASSDCKTFYIKHDHLESLFKLVV